MKIIHEILDVVRVLRCCGIDQLWLFLCHMVSNKIQACYCMPLDFVQTSAIYLLLTFRFFCYHHGFPTGGIFSWFDLKNIISNILVFIEFFVNVSQT